MWSLLTSTIYKRNKKGYKRNMKGMLIPTVNYLRVVGCEHDVAKRTESNEGHRKGHLSRKNAYEGLPI